MLHKKAGTSKRAILKLVEKDSGREREQTRQCVKERQNSERITKRAHTHAHTHSAVRGRRKTHSHTEKKTHTAEHIHNLWFGVRCQNCFYARSNIHSCVGHTFCTWYVECVCVCVFYWCWKCFAAAACVCFLLVVVLFCFNFPSLDFILSMVIRFLSLPSVSCVCVLVWYALRAQPFHGCSMFIFRFLFHIWSPSRYMCRLVASLQIIWSIILYLVRCFEAAINHTYTQFSQWKENFIGSSMARNELFEFTVTFSLPSPSSRFCTQIHINRYKNICICCHWAHCFTYRIQFLLSTNNTKKRRDRNIKIRQQFKWFLHVEYIFIECAICTNPLWMAIKSLI